MFHTRFVKLVFCLSALSFSCLAMAQNTKTVAIEIPWSSDSGNDLEWSDEYAKDQNGLPLFSISEKVGSPVAVNTAQLINSVWEDVQFSDQLAAFVPSDAQLDARVTTSADSYELVIDLVPVRRNDQTGQIQRLLSADISWTSKARSANKSLTFADQSALAEGEWYKIAVGADGVYRINASLLTSMGASISQINPQNINVYGNGGQMLPFDNELPRYDDLQKNAIEVVGGQDGNFDGGDYIVFYGRGADSWKRDESSLFENPLFEHTRHHYTDSAYYFIRVDDTDPLRISNAPDVSAAADVTIDRFHDRQFIEKELANLNKSGRRYYGDRFEATPSINFSFNAPNPTNDLARLDYALLARSVGVGSSFDISVANENLNVFIDSSSDNEISPVAKQKDGALTFTPDGNATIVNLTFNAGNPSAIGWLDYLRLNVTRFLTMAGGSMEFSNADANEPTNVYEYQLGNAGAVNSIWDITDYLNPQNVSFDGSSTKTWKKQSDQPNRYIAFGSGGFKTPVGVGKVANQNLHALEQVDYIMITRPALMSACEALAEIHRENGLEVAIVTQGQVFNEFSCGSPDVTAIKMMMKMLYDRANMDPELLPQYLLLMGDGTYRNREELFSNNVNLITYQSIESLSPVASYVSDDYFALLSDDDSEKLSDKLDIGVGRMPVRNLSEANNAVDKVRRYLSTNSNLNPAINCAADQSGSSFGNWRNIICFVADDQDGNSDQDQQSHMLSSEQYAAKIVANHNAYNIEKIYMDAFQQVSTPGGERYPDVNTAVNQRVQNGALIVNYVGHGGEKGWAHERILNIPTIQNWTNTNRMPVFMTATCELSRYDDPDFLSAGELMFLNANGGAIAMFTTTRIVFSGQNNTLTNAFYDYALQDELYPNLAMGDISRLTKNAPTTSSIQNKRNFSLLGDPALQMVYPQQDVLTSTINGTPVGEAQETLNALEEVTITGFVTNASGEPDETFNGLVYPTVFDKPLSLQSLVNDTGNPFPFELYKSILYRGKATVSSGEFSFTFLVPKDIAYNVSQGRISYYAVDVEDGIDAHGFNEEFLVGGNNPSALDDKQSPRIELFMNDSTFVAGGITDEKPYLFARMSDESGINTVGNGIGHDMVATLDGNVQAEVVVNDFYESDTDTYKSGSLLYQYDGLSDGPHTLQLKVWDVHNNSATSSTDFVVASSAGIALDHVLNYPNPFTTNTEFMFEHNQSCQTLDVQVQIFTVSGKLVKTINKVVINDGFRQSGIRWNGRDDYGDKIGRGTYVYRLKVTNPEIGRSDEVFEKLVLLR